LESNSAERQPPENPPAQAGAQPPVASVGAQLVRELAVARARAQEAFVLRLWRGDISLPITYWVFLVLARVVQATITWVIGFYARGVWEVNCTTVACWFGVLAFSIFVVAIVLFSLVYTVFSSIAVWRSSRKYEGPQVWAWLAQLTVVTGIFVAIRVLFSDLESIFESGLWG